MVQIVGLPEEGDEVMEIVPPQEHQLLVIGREGDRWAGALVDRANLQDATELIMSKVVEMIDEKLDRSSGGIEHSGQTPDQPRHGG